MAGTTEGPYDVGDVARLSVAVTIDGAAGDPSTIALAIQKPDGTVLTPTPAHDGTGAYHYDLPLDVSGHWHYRFTTTGTGAAAEESDFWVRTPAF